MLILILITAAIIKCRKRFLSTWNGKKIEKKS